MQRNKKFIGVDVSKLRLDVTVQGNKCHVKIANDSVGFKQMTSWLMSIAFTASLVLLIPSYIR